MNKSLHRLFILLILLIGSKTNAQKFPDEMHMSLDERRLVVGGILPYTGFYDSNTIHTVNFQFSSPGFWTTLTNNFPSRTDMPVTMTVDGVVYDSVGVRFKGNSSYSAIGNSDKKSFNISLDDYIPGQNIGGYNTIVFNNCYNDPSFMAEVIYEQQISKHIPSPHGSFVHLYINGLDWGIYDNVEQLNHDYEKEWFLSHTGAMWRARNPHGSPAPGGSNGDSLASLYDFGIDTNFYSLHYNLKSSNIPDPWTRLMTTIRVLDTVSAADAESVLADYLDIDQAMWLIASEGLFGDDDSYLYKARKDYYIYYEPESGRLIPLEMDGNDAYDPTRANASIFLNSANPNFTLMYKLWNMPVIRQRYLAHLRTLVKDELDTVEDFSYIDSYYQMLDTFVQTDPKKLYTYADFLNKKQVMKQFIIDRAAHISANAEIAEIPPVITNTTFYSDSIAWKRPVANQDVWVTANVTSANGIDHVGLYYAGNLTGKFLKTVMLDDGLHHDQAAGDGIYGATITGKPGATWERFYVEAVANNAAKTVVYDPAGAEHDVYTYLVLPSQASDTSVVINELMAKNISTATDSAGGYEDWIELYNNSGVSKDISGFYLTDKKYNLLKWKFASGSVIPSHGYQIIWADESKWEGNFNTNYNLSSTHGENLLLLNTNHEVVDEVTFGPQIADKGYARVPNGTGQFVIQSPTFFANNNSVPHAAIAPVDTVCDLDVSFTNNSANSTSYTWNFGDGSSTSGAVSPVHSFLSPGTYVVSLFATNGMMTDIAYDTIVVFNDAAVTFASDTLSTSGVTYQLDAGPGFPSYHWSTNASTQAITVASTGLYCVDVVTQHGCISQTCVYVIVDALGIENTEEHFTGIYPNPANDHLVLLTNDTKKISAAVYNSLGEEIYKNNFSGSVVLDTRAWSEGVYLARLGNISKVLIIAH